MRTPVRRRRLLAAAVVVIAAAGVAALLGASHLLRGHAAAQVRPASLPEASAPVLPPLRHHPGAMRMGHSPPATLPFRPPRGERSVRPGEVPSLYADGLVCSVGCRPYLARLGWPLKPFHHEHPLRAGLNELRPESLHVGLDIQARDGAPVYAVQPGIARVLEPTGPNARVQVGNYVYWHIDPRVLSGEEVVPFHTVLGRVMRGYGHIAFSEVDGAENYVNPLRPDGSVLSPYVDRAEPVIGRPALSSTGQMVIAAYSPQSFVRRTTYITPVLAPAGLAYRLRTASGAAVTPLEWAFRGTHLLPWTERRLIYAPGAHAPGYACFAHRRVCVPHWSYRLAGGLASSLPTGLEPGRYRLTVYAWNWADHATALDLRLRLTSRGWRPLGHFPTGLLLEPGFLSGGTGGYAVAKRPMLRSGCTPCRWSLQMRK